MKAVKSAMVALALLVVGSLAFAEDCERFDVCFQGCRTGEFYQACAECYLEYAISEDNGVRRITFYVLEPFTPEETARLSKNPDVVDVGDCYITYAYANGTECLSPCAHCRF